MTDQAEQLQKNIELRQQAECDQREIERLTRERDEAWAERDPYIESNVKLVAEIERLRGHKEEADRHIAVIAELRTEIEQLKASLKMTNGGEPKP